MRINTYDLPEPSPEELEMDAFDAMQEHFGQNFDDDYEDED